MPFLKGITVSVLSGGMPLKEYDDPDETPQDQSIESVKYIESVTGATFNVHVSVLGGYDFGRCDGLKVQLSFDGGDRIWLGFISKSDTLQNQANGIYRFQNFTVFDPATQQWRNSNLCFAEVKLKEGHGAEQASLKSLSKLGTIKVRVVRVHRKKRAPCEGRRDGFTEVSEVSEKLLKGKAITNSVKYVLGAPLPAPAPQWYYIEDIPKPLGEAVTFEYRYRSYHALQITGLIPRSPSAEAEKPPDSVHRLGTRANLGAIGDNTNAEITALRERLALLESNAEMAIKSEDSSITGNGHSLLRNQAPRIKRERDENSPNMNTVQGAATVKRQRKSDTIETVDLTGDAPVIKTESRGFDRAKGPVVDLSED